MIHSKAIKVEGHESRGSDDGIALKFYIWASLIWVVQFPASSMIGGAIVLHGLLCGTFALEPGPFKSIISL